MSGLWKTLLIAITAILLSPMIGSIFVGPNADVAAAATHHQRQTLTAPSAPIPDDFGWKQFRMIEAKTTYSILFEKQLKKDEKWAMAIFPESLINCDWAIIFKMDDENCMVHESTQFADIEAVSIHFIDVNAKHLNAKKWRSELRAFKKWYEERQVLVDYTLRKLIDQKNDLKASLTKEKEALQEAHDELKGLKVALDKAKEKLDAASKKIKKNETSTEKRRKQMMKRRKQMIKQMN